VEQRKRKRDEEESTINKSLCNEGGGPVNVLAGETNKGIHFLISFKKN
jgi:hypothetical protein